MKQISCLNAYELEFSKEGAVFKPEQIDEIEARLNQGDITDLLVMSHGWNNDMQDARQLYELFFGAFCKQLAAHPLADRKLALLTVLWPSKKFADRDLIPGGGASVSDLAEEGLSKAVNTLKDLFGDSRDFDKAVSLLVRLEDDSKAQRDFVDLLRSKVPRNEKSEREDGLQHLFNQPGDQILSQLQRPIVSTLRQPEGGQVSAADFRDADSQDFTKTREAGLGDTLRGAQGAAMRFANLLTYYGMKERAGVVGIKGLNPVLVRLAGTASKPRIHLVGHSFGGRLVAAAASASPIPKLQSLTLCQAALSHFGFASQWEPGSDGTFRNVISENRVSGPILVTQSIQDVPVGIAYAIASKISNTIGAAAAEANELVRPAGILDRTGEMALAGLRLVVGGPNDLYGGIGRNGALGLKDGEGVKVTPIHKAGEPYDFSGARVQNLVGDACITGHGDICGPEVTYAVLQAIAHAS
jgi:hypothetical protein